MRFSFLFAFAIVFMLLLCSQQCHGALKCAVQHQKIVDIQFVSVLYINENWNKIKNTWTYKYESKTMRHTHAHTLHNSNSNNKSIILNFATFDGVEWDPYSIRIIWFLFHGVVLCCCCIWSLFGLIYLHLPHVHMHSNIVIIIPLSALGSFQYIFYEKRFRRFNIKMRLQFHLILSFFHWILHFSFVPFVLS